MMKTALIIGAAGFLGSHLKEKLKEKVDFIAVIDPKFPRSEPLHPEYAGLGRWSATFEEWLSWQAATTQSDTRLPRQYDYVFHLAASLTGHNIAERNKMGMDAFSDIGLDFKVAQYLEMNPPRERIVWMSSAAVDAKDTENYAFVKYVSERFARTLALKELPITILKPYGGYGPGQSLNYPMSAIIDRALRKEDPLIVWGNAHTVRDWIYVDDVVDAMIMAAEGAFPKRVGAMPIGTGIPTSFGDLAKQIAEQVGYSPTIQADFTKPIGSNRRVAEIHTAKNFGFEAKVKLADGIAKCIEAQRTK